MHRTYVRRRRTVAIAIAALLAVAVSPAGAGAVLRDDAEVPAPGRTVVVRPGDTLWSIAQRARPGADPRETVLWIEQVNGVEPGSLQAGQSLLVPSG